MDFVLTVIVPVTTLCPCSKAISIHGAHNQRGQVTLAVRFGKPIWIEDLIRLVEDCASSELYSCSNAGRKGGDRARLRESRVRRGSRAQCRPALRRGCNIRWYRVEAENFESIHNHNAYALVEKPTARNPA